MSSQPQDTPLLCRRCGAQVMPGSGNHYRITIEAVADPVPPNLSKEDLTQDFESQIKQLLARMQELSEQEAMDQVFRRVTLYLCNGCYRSWIEDPTG